MFPASALNEFVARSPSARSLIMECQDKWDGESSEVVDDIDKDTRVVDREVNF